MTTLQSLIDDGLKMIRAKQRSLNMTKKLLCSVPGTPVEYEIEIGKGFLTQEAFLLQTFQLLGSRFAIVADDKVVESYGHALHRLLSAIGLETFLFSFPQGEAYKTRAIKENLENQLFEKGLGRDTCIIAMGGGVSTDLGGYLAATYCRGVPLVMVPTSLLAMVDASIGGKTGVNVPYGKNLVGCIYQPKKVIIDISTLKTLPLQEFRNGVAEMIKHGLIADSQYFDYLDANADKILSLDFDALERAIFESCRIKKEIVEADEKENGQRRLLNFGHTVAHALEHLTNYDISHGEAVSIGIAVESYLATKLGNLAPSALNKIESILTKYGLPLKPVTKFSISSLLDAMTLDKKSVRGKPRFPILNDIGSALPCHSNYCMHVDESALINSLEWMNRV